MNKKLDRLASEKKRKNDLGKNKIDLSRKIISAEIDVLKKKAQTIRPEPVEPPHKDTTEDKSNLPAKTEIETTETITDTDESEKLQADEYSKELQEDIENMINEEDEKSKSGTETEDEGLSIKDRFHKLWMELTGRA